MRLFFQFLSYVLSCHSLPSFQQETFGPDITRVLIPAHADPLPARNMEALMMMQSTTSDRLCNVLYSSWIIYLRRFMRPAIVNAVQSTEVDWYEPQIHGFKYFRVDCLDIRSYLNWLRVYMKQHAVQMDDILNNPYPHREPWFWLPEEAQQGTWLMQCPPTLIPRKRERVNGLGNLDTHAICEDPDEVEEEEPSRSTATATPTKAWYETDLSVRHINHPWRSDPLEVAPAPKRQKITQTTCTDVHVAKEAEDQARMLQIKGAIFLGLTLSCHLLYVAGSCLS